MTEEDYAPGWPGIPPRWTSSAKSGAGTSFDRVCRVWFTLSHGILNEVYYPRLDQACTRDMGMIVTDGKGYFSEEKRYVDSRLEYLADGVPAYRLVNTCKQGRYRIEKEIIVDPQRDSLLQLTNFTPLVGGPEDYHLCVLLAPHLGNWGYGNTAWVGDYKGVPMLFAERDGNALALACSAPWLKRSAGFVGVSDGWQDLIKNKQMTWEYSRAENGNTALTGEIDFRAVNGPFLIVMGFGVTGAEAGNQARASILAGFDKAKDNYIKAWKEWQDRLMPLDKDESDKNNIYRTSTAVMHMHEAKRFLGGAIASLSIPWGTSKGDDDIGGYHLVWPRDMAETVGGLLAAGASDAVLDALQYLQVTQEENGHWPQNMWLDGTPYWNGIQMDEAAFPILLVDTAFRENILDESGTANYWPMVKKAASYILMNGPVTQQDRWEELPGYSPFTLAVEISALLAAADLAERQGEGLAADYLRETADFWNARIEYWIYASDTELTQKYGVKGYYKHVSNAEPPDVITSRHNALSGHDGAEDSISTDALALVRFGLRKPDDPRILNTVKIIDGELRVETQGGSVWLRHNRDVYGEHADGLPFNGSGIGRAWPLLTGERAHYELAAGRRNEAERLLKAMEAFANEGGMISEQVWDTDDIPERELFKGRPTGSAMPLVWAHAEYIKLRRSLSDGKVFDMPPQTFRRYIKDNVGSRYGAWRFNNKCKTIPAGMTLRLETLDAALVHWSSDGWKTTQDTETRDTGMGVYVADLPTVKLPAGATVTFTFYWRRAGRWEGTDYQVELNMPTDS
ncbi:MAG: glucan 1,4-alpha-glucosidase [Nitrospirota bacterium]